MWLPSLTYFIELMRSRRHPKPTVTPEDFKRLEELVSVLSDKIAQTNASADAALTRVQAEVATLRSQEAALQAQIDAGGSPADLKAMDDLKAKLDGLDWTNPATVDPTTVKLA